MTSDHEIARRALSDMLKQRTSDLSESLSKLVAVEKKMYGDRMDVDSVLNPKLPESTVPITDLTRPLPTHWEKGDKRCIEYDVECRYLNPRKSFDPPESEVQLPPIKNTVHTVPRCAYTNYEKERVAQKTLKKFHYDQKRTQELARKPFK